jgi:predicted ferric reductase
MLAKKYLSKIISISNSFEGVYTLEFESLGRSYKYQPGQFLHLAIDEEYDGIGQWPDSRCFSMQSNPAESTIKITYAVKGTFTKEMEQKLKIGSEVWLKLPFGDLFQQPHSKQNTVFIAGGTGVTPYLSLFTNESFAGYVNPNIYLGFRSKELNIYQMDLKRLQVINPNLSLNIIYQDTDGILDIEKIFNENGLEPNYFISGPPIMIKEVKDFLIKMEVTAEKIITDDWE